MGAVCETAGQFAYIYAIADTEHLAMSAPIIASYCAASVLWSRIFLKEKLSWKHYLMILLIIIGIAHHGLFRHVRKSKNRPCAMRHRGGFPFNMNCSLSRVLLDLLIQTAIKKARAKPPRQHTTDHRTSAGLLYVVGMITA